jgi:hypothetical protein
VIVQHHWWNGTVSSRFRRDVFIRSDGDRWEVMVQIGGATGPTKTQECPGRASAKILAGAWRGGGAAWKEMATDDA